MKSLRRTIELTKNNSSNKQNQLDELKRDIRALKEELEKATTSNQEKDSEIQLLVSTRKDLPQHSATNTHDRASKLNQHRQENYVELQNMKRKIEALLEENDTLAGQVKDASDAYATMTSTLSTVRVLIHGAPAQNPSLSIKTSLQDILNMIQGRLNSGTGMSRERDEDVGVSQLRLAKRVKLEDVIEIN